MMSSNGSLANNLTQAFPRSFAGLAESAQMRDVTLHTDRLASDMSRGTRTASHVEAPVQSIDPSGSRNWARILRSMFRRLRSPYLVNTGIVVLLYAIASHPNFNLAKIASNAFPCLGAKTCLMAVVNIVANEFIPTVQAFLTGRLVRWMWAITLLPMIGMVRLVTTAKLRSALRFVRCRMAQLAIARRSSCGEFTHAPRQHPPI